MSTVEELTFTRETFGPAPSTVIGIRLGRSKPIGNVVVLPMTVPREGRRKMVSQREPSTCGCQDKAGLSGDARGRLGAPQAPAGGVRGAPP
jgi:hypothetical protein